MSIIENTKELLNEFNDENLTEDTIISSMQYALESKNLIKQSLQNKGSDIDNNTVFRDYHKEIDKLGDVEEEWSPNPEWYDIDKILEEDTEPYPGKVIMLLDDFNDELNFDIKPFDYTKAKLSDGTEFDSNTNIVHTWDKSKDKDCSDGYKTRYIIFYFEDGQCQCTGFNFRNLIDTLYIIMKDVTFSYERHNSNYLFPNFSKCECVKLIDVVWNDTVFMLQSMFCLRSVYIENSTFPNIIKQFSFNNCYLLKRNDFLKQNYKTEITDYANIFSTNYYLKEFEMPDTSNVTSFVNFATNDTFLKKVKGVINLKNCINTVNMFNRCCSLKNNPVPDGEGSNVEKCNSMYSFNFFLKHLDFNTSNSTDIGNFVSSCLNLIDLKLHDTSKANSFYASFSNCFKLKNIDVLDFDNATNINNLFNNCVSLKNIDEVRNIKITGLNFSACPLNHDTLIRILNALYDYADDGGVYTIIFGATNLSKLTEEEKAIATNKGWTLN